MFKGQKAKAIGTPAADQRGVAKALDQSAIVVGMGAISATTPISWKRQRCGRVTRCRCCGARAMAGKATERKAWYKASMLWSASAKTKNPDAAVAWINWFVNYPEAAEDRPGRAGHARRTPRSWQGSRPSSPASSRPSQKYIADIKPELADTPIAPRPAAAR